MDENVAAPAPTGEAAPLTTNPEPAVLATPALPNESAQPQPFTLEEAHAIKSFLDSNGGFEKVKKNLTARQADIQAQMRSQQPLPEPMMQQPHAPVPEPATQRIKGGITPDEFMTQQYFEHLSRQEQYNNIADQISSGSILKEMSKFNIQPMINGQFNTEGIKNFLDLYAKTVPATPAQDAITPTPTVDYVQVGETINSMNDAMRVLQQDQQMRAQGLPGHPMAKQANEFFDGVLNANQNRGKVEHTTLEEARKK